MSEPTRQPHDELALAAARGILVEAARRPWLASLILRRRTWLAQLADHLAALPRHFRRFLRRRLAPGLSLAALLLAMAAPFPARAGTITVDEVTCTLADAITTANTGVDTGGCTGGSAGAIDTIDLQADVSLMDPLPAIDDGLTLMGNMHLIARSPGAATNFSVITVNASVAVDIRDAAITGGVSDTDGGGINNAGQLNLSNVTIDGNSAANYGGGINNTGSSLVCDLCTISNNSAGLRGGGIFSNTTIALSRSQITGNQAEYGGGINQYGSNLFIVASTISNNTASRPGFDSSGGGIFSNMSSVSIDRSTISLNTVSGYGAFGGGLMLVGGTADIKNSTIAFNDASGTNYSGGGGVYESIASATLMGTLLDSNTLDGIAENNCYGTFSSLGHNAESGNTCGLSGTGDQINATTNLDTTLTNNGGPTPTHGFTATSAVVDAIPDGESECALNLSVDQREAVRGGGANRGGTACDIGAFEYDSFETPTAITNLSVQASPAAATGLGASLAGIGAALAGGWALLRRKRSG